MLYELRGEVLVPSIAEVVCQSFSYIKQPQFPHCNRRNILAHPKARTGGAEKPDVICKISGKNCG